MPLSYSTDSPDSLEVLLKKAHAINTINKEILEFISECRKEHHVLTDTTTKPNTKKRKIVNSDDDNDDQHGDNDQNIHFSSILADEEIRKVVNYIIRVWEYNGETLEQELIAFDGLIDIRFERFHNLTRLVNDYDILLEKYTLALKDVEESRAATEVVLHNLEKLQVALGKIHMQVLDATDPVNVRKCCMVASNFQSLECKSIVADLERPIKSLKTYVSNDKHYLVGVCHNVHIWDLSNNEVVATLELGDWNGNELFVKDGVQMLAIWDDSQIQIWNLSTKAKEKTINVEKLHNCIEHIAIYEKDNKSILVARYDVDFYFYFWDLDNNEFIGSEHGEQTFIFSIQVYYRDGKPYLFIKSSEYVGDGDEEELYICIYDLEEFRLVKKLEIKDDFGHFCLIANQGNEQVLVSGNKDSEIQIWSLNSYRCMEKFRMNNTFRNFFEMFRYNDKLYLASPGNDGTVTIYDIQSQSEMVTLSIGTNVSAIAAYMNGDKPCLVTGDEDGNIKFWTK